ncbi:Uncharacterised protein [Mycobacterium tuberculosis]|nr:Uncharacterised protein [Mycobacterium tuberculosis]CKW26657.1 Uncharacterised protein [Mycobacterium tuberculosis]
MIWIYNFNIAICQNVTSCYFSRTFNIQFDDFFVFNVRFHCNSFNVQNDLHHVFTNTWNCVKLM